MCMRILLVEDDRTIAVGLVYALEQEGYAVHHVRMLPGANWRRSGSRLTLPSST